MQSKVHGAPTVLFRENPVKSTARVKPLEQFQCKNNRSCVGSLLSIMGVGNDLSKDNGNSVKPYESIPRLPLGNVHHRPLSSSCKTFFNIVIMVVGAGVLGLPHAFMQSGWFQGLLILEGTSATMYYCMMLLVSCRRHLEREGIVDSVNTYSELGRHILGMAGQVSVDAMIVVSQVGFCVAYLIFIGENLASVYARANSLSSPLRGSRGDPSRTLASDYGMDFMGLNWKTQSGKLMADSGCESMPLHGIDLHISRDDAPSLRSS